jgi:uncharacterized protein involved in outer membrane biogenesis
MKRIALGFALLLILGSLGLVLLARWVLTGDNVRAAVAAQLESAIGQPVTIGGLGASIYPRVTMELTDVSIGQPTRIQLRRAHVGTDFRALLSRRIEHAAVLVNGARIELPLPPFALHGATASDGAGASTSESPIEIASVDEIVLTDVSVIGGGRTLQGAIEIVPQGSGVVLRRVSLAADETTVEMTGAIDSLSPLKGRVEARATAVNFDRLLAFFSDFAAAPAPASATASASSPAGGSLAGSLVFDLTLGRATTGALSLSDVRTTATVNPKDVTLSPLAFGVFSGRYEGSMHLTLGEATRFRWQGNVSGIDTGSVMAFASTPNTITGTLAGTVALEGTGLQMEQALRTSRGTVRVDIANGSIAGLALVRTIVLATSGRGGYATSAQTAVTSQGTSSEAERFSRLGATLALADGVIRTNDFAMQSTDVDLTGAGAVALATMATEMRGQVRLSNELSKKGGTDLYRYAQQDGRVTLPVTVSGPLTSLSVRIDVAQAASRAIRNRATEELNKAIERNLPGGLRGLFPKKPPN